MKTPAKPRRLQIKKYCQIAGILEGKILGPGLYVAAKNIDEESFDKLLSPQFSHAIEVLPDEEPEPTLATPVNAPQESEGDKYRRKIREAEEATRAERWGGKRPYQLTVPD